MLRVIDNKRVDLTDSEFKLYQEICLSYDRPNFEGKDLFKGLFETDKNGIIIFMVPPKSKYTSMEVYMFLVSVMIHQHLGTACEHVDKLVLNLDAKLKAADNVIRQGNELIKELKTHRDSIK